jgi:hypothetical protein
MAQDIKKLLQEAGLNSIYREYLKSIDAGLYGGNKPGRLLQREKYSEAERYFMDSQVSTCFLLTVFPIMSKQVVFKPIQQGKRSELKKSKEIADFLNYSLRKIKKGGVRQLQFDLMTAKYYGESFVELVYGLLNQGKYDQYYYYPQAKAKRTGLWDYVYDQFENIIGYRSLLEPDKIWPKEKFMNLSWLPFFNNPHGTGDFESIWKPANAKEELIINLVDLASRQAKGKQNILQGGPTDPETVEAEHKTVLKNLNDNLSVYLPEGYEVKFEHFKTEQLTNYLDAIRFFNSEIAVKMVGSSLAVNESSQGTGTYAQSKVHQGNMFTFEDYAEGILCDCFDEQYAPNLIRLNYDISKYPEEIWPYCELVPPENIDLNLEVTKDQALKNLGVIDTDTETDMNYLRTKYNLPDNDELFLKLVSDKTEEPEDFEDEEEE